MIFLVLSLGIVVGCVLGRFLFGRWFNHCSLYSVVWGVSLILFEVRLIRYYPLEPETWLLIGSAWLAFIVGSVTVAAFRFSQLAERGCPPQKKDNQRAFNPGEYRFIRWVLLCGNMITGIHALYQTILALRLMGSFTNIVLWGNLLYTQRVSEGIPGTIPYIGHIALATSFLGGVYTAVRGKIRIVAFLPLLIVMLEAIVNMGRSTMIIGIILFLSGYALAKSRAAGGGPVVRTNSFQRYGSIALALVLVVLGAEAVRSSRGTIETFTGETSALGKLRGSAFITPSIYLYASVHHGVFNTYLKSGNENVRFGNYTLAPFWRTLAKAGFDTDVKQYQSYYRTPVGANTGTYLREIHADFGIFGVCLLPYVLGLAASGLWFRYQRTGRLFHLAILCHLYVVIGMSIFIMATQLGYWWISCISAALLAGWIDRRMGKAPALIAPSVGMQQ